MKKKGNKKMPIQRQKVIQPHPYITLCIISSNAQQVKLCIKKNKDVGIGLDDFLSLDGHLLVPFFFMR